MRNKVGIMRYSHKYDLLLAIPVQLFVKFTRNFWVKIVLKPFLIYFLENPVN